jgi:hypothetical protein
LRKKGYGREDAQDLTQGFFAHLIKNRGYAYADREKGRFRAFLLGALKNFIAGAVGRRLDAIVRPELGQQDRGRS